MARLWTSSGRPRGASCASRRNRAQTRIVRKRRRHERPECVVDDLQRHIGRRHLDHGDLELRDLLPTCPSCRRPSGTAGGSSRYRAGFRNALLPDRIFDDILCRTRCATTAAHHFLERLFGLRCVRMASDGCGRAETAPARSQSPCPAEQNVADGTRTSFKKHLRVAVRLHRRNRTPAASSRRDALGIARHQDLRLLLMTRRAGIGLAHHDQNLTARIADAGRPPFAALIT